ncbi:MAG: hypothetical protein ABL903_06060 [Methylococcales bacterium]
MRGAGGTNGGIGQFWLGLAMMCGGFYLLFKSILVSTSFGFGYQLYGLNLFGSLFSITSGMVMIPFIFGIGMIFYNAKNLLGWILTLGSLIALIFGVIASMHFSFITMSAFDLLVILVLAFGGLGLFLKSLAVKQ